MNMEDKKYYTPKIEELYVGLEYEFRNFLGKWKKRTFDIKSAHRVLSNLIYMPDHFRVKCLDHEDILSLGWRWEDGFNGCYTHPDGFSLVRTLPNTLIERFKGKGTLFWGVIRNKSELKTLMNQLKIS